jgi:hypothetical protein
MKLKCGVFEMKDGFTAINCSQTKEPKYSNMAVTPAPTGLKVRELLLPRRSEVPTGSDKGDSLCLALLACLRGAELTPSPSPPSSFECSRGIMAPNAQSALLWASDGAEGALLNSSLPDGEFLRLDN